MKRQLFESERRLLAIEATKTRTLGYFLQYRGNGYGPYASKDAALASRNVEQRKYGYRILYGIAITVKDDNGKPRLTYESRLWPVVWFDITSGMEVEPLNYETP